MLLLILGFILGLIAGALYGRRNGATVDAAVAWSKDKASAAQAKIEKKLQKK
jgi:hypothetical protein